MLIRNTIANFVGQLLYPLLALALVPFYVRHVGIEGYGLIGLIAMIVSVLGVFSRGLGSALQREFGRRSATPEGCRSLPTLLRSFEVVYWLLGAALGVILAVVALSTGARWIRADTIPHETILTCLGLLALRVALAFPHSVYQSVFIGTERQLQGNVLNALLAVSSAAAGVAAILIFGSVVAVYAAESMLAGLFLLIFRARAFAVLPAVPAVFAVQEVRGLLGISTDLIWTNGIGLLITTLDRVVISAALPVAAFGIYTAASSVARAVGLGLNPFLTAAYPETCRTATIGSQQQQVDHLLQTAVVVAALGAAVTMPLAAFSADVLQLWLADAVLARAGAPVVSACALGSLAIGLATVLYQWQMATGATRYGVKFNTAALIWFPLILWLMVARFGLVGAALAWLTYSVAAWAYHIAVTFKPSGLGSAARLAYLRAVTMAVVPMAAIVTITRLVADRLLSASEGRLTVLFAAVVLCVCWGASVLLVLSPTLRTGWRQMLGLGTAQLSKNQTWSI
jgi:O-antigen/teichoic acid export membrane protein